MGRNQQRPQDFVNSLIPSTRRPLVLVSGAYRAPTKLGIMRNVIRARGISRFLWDSHISNICPHLNSIFMPESDLRFLHGYLEMVYRVDALVMVPGWENSEGAQTEYALANRLGKPIFINALLSCVSWHEERMKDLTDGSHQS